MLICQILKPELHNLWLALVEKVGPLLERAICFGERTFSYRMKIASHYILACASFSTSQFVTLVFLSEDQEKSTKIESSTGLSPALLLTIQNCNKLAFSKNMDKDSEAAKDILDYLSKLCQYCDPSEVDLSDLYTSCDLSDRIQKLDEVVGVTERTAESYRLATIIYVFCRVLQTRPSDLIWEDEFRLLLSLPIQGELFKAIWPLYPLFVCSVGVLISYGPHARELELWEVWTGLAANSSRSVSIKFTLYPSDS